MFVNVAGFMIGGAGFPVATPVILGSSAVAVGLGLVVGLAAGALVLGSGLRLRMRAAARRVRSGRARGSTLVAPGRR